MAGTFNPTVATDIGFRDPIQTEGNFSAAGTLFDTAGSVLAAYAKSNKPTDGGGGKEREAQALRPFAQELQKVMSIKDQSQRMTRAQLLVQKQLTIHPEYQSQVGELYETITGVAMPTPEVSMEDAMTQGLNDFMKTAEGQAALLLSASYDDQGNVDPDATRLKLQGAYGNYAVEKATLDSITRERDILKISQEIVGMRVEKEFLPGFQNKVMSVASGLLSRLPLGIKQGETPVEMMANVQYEMDRLGAEYGAKLTALGLNPRSEQFNIERVMTPLTNLKNSLSVVASLPGDQIKYLQSLGELKLTRILGDNGIPPAPAAVEAFGISLVASQIGNLTVEARQKVLDSTPDFFKAFNKSWGITVSGDSNVSNTPPYNQENVKRLVNAPPEEVTKRVQGSTAALSALTPELAKQHPDQSVDLVVGHFAMVAEGLKPGPLSANELKNMFSDKAIQALSYFPEGSQSRLAAVQTAVSALDREIAKNFMGAKRRAEQYDRAISFDGARFSVEVDPQEQEQMDLEAATSGVTVVDPFDLKDLGNQTAILYDRYSRIMGPEKARAKFKQFNIEPNSSFTFKDGKLVGTGEQ